MNDKIQETDICSLQNASMKYPTWNLFKDSIKEANDINFPSSSFGNCPMKPQNAPLVQVAATQKLEEIINNHGYVGIDVPVLLVPVPKDSSNKTIVIVGESPLRDTNDSTNQNIVLLGTPYAIHQGFGCPSQCNVYKKIFSDLLEKGYSIYLTDIIKVWWEGKKGKELKADDIDKQLLKEEIEYIKENNDDFVIVAWGRKAKDYLKKWNNIPTIIELPHPIIELPHPSQQNWNNWKLFIFEKAVYDKQDINYTGELYPQKDSQTSEIIVAQEAVNEILEQIRKNP